MTEPDLDDIQGIVYSAWSDHVYAGYLFATLVSPERSRAWLSWIRPHVTPARRERRQPHGRVQVALSPQGLEVLGVPRDVVELFPQETKEGMAHRGRVLDDAPPTQWQLGIEHELHVLVMVFARDHASRAALLEEHRAKLLDAGARVREPELSHPLEGREHFGFTDGISQPHLHGVHGEPRAGQDTIATGEILLGYHNEYGCMPASPRWGTFDLGKNGTYLVFRKLQQHVAAFWSYVRGQAEALGGDDALADLLAAKLMGRWRSGAPLALTPDRDDATYCTPERINRFAYRDGDPDGLACPIASHVRRANPRDARGGSAHDSIKVVNRHRILRRGRSYGAPLERKAALEGRDDGTERGLYFICLQASIARGFEFIQQTWLSNPGFGGLHGEPDPITGNTTNGTCCFTIPADPVRVRLHGIPSVVTVRGGGYFFLPSLAALARIAEA